MDSFPPNPDSILGPIPPVEANGGSGSSSSALPDPWLPIVLSLDGGGVRGYSSLLILQAVMQAVGGPNGPTPLPCEYFDYIIGTSTGGLIAIMLGRLRMSVDDALREYENLSNRVFRSPRWWRLTKYDGDNLKDVIRDVVSRYCRAHATGPCNGDCPFAQPDATEGIMCKTAVVTQRKRSEKLKKNVKETYLFRSYDHIRRFNYPRYRLELNPSHADDVSIWQAGLATASAPRYFRNAKIDGVRYMDGAVGSNNPSTIAYYEAQQMQQSIQSSQTSEPPQPLSPAVALQLSIGTGRSRIVSRFGSGSKEMWRLLKYSRRALTDTERDHDNMLGLTSNGVSPRYFRLSVDSGLEGIRLDEWRRKKKRGNEVNLTMQLMREKTQDYLARAVHDIDGEDVVVKVQECAELLRQYHARRQVTILGTPRARER